MSALRFDRYGPPADVLSLVPSDVTAPGEHEVQVEVLASPINPMDLLLLRGLYPVPSDASNHAGAEGIARVCQLGASVASLRVGELVLLPIRFGSWRSRANIEASRLCPLPDGVDIEQASMLRINPLTAEVLLDAFADLQPGDWLIHSPGSGSVGQYIVQLAKRRGFRTVSVVRRAERGALVRELGGDRVEVDGVDLPRRVRAATGRAAIKLGLDGSGGPCAGRLAACLAPGSSLVTYGAMSRKPPQVGIDQLVFRGIHVVGFWLLEWSRRAGSEVVDRRVVALAGQSLRSQIAACYPLSAWREALAHAAHRDREGRVLLLPSSS
ncbi:MAG: zinc-dependent alcohol dehydrogenase family protein [Nannocystaceae bacterium]